MISSQRGKFKAMDTVLSDKAARKIFNDKWSPELLRIFTQNLGNGHHRLKGSELSLGFDGDWVRCTACKSIYRPVPAIKHCLHILFNHSFASYKQDWGSLVSK